MDPHPGRLVPSRREADAAAHAGFLSALPETGRDLVLGAARQRRYAAGEVVVRQGNEARSLYLIESGRVAVRFATPAGDSMILGVLGPGDIFGEVGVLGLQQERTATAEAVDAVTLRVLRHDDFQRLRRTSLDVDDFVMQAMAGQVRRLSRLLAEALHVSVDRRVARRLYEVGRMFAEPGGPLVLPFNQEEIAQLAGTTRPTVNQSLKKLEALGALRLSRGQVEIVDTGLLRQRCGWTAESR